MGYGHEDMRVWNPRREAGDLTEADIKEATFLLWNGRLPKADELAALRKELAANFFITIMT